jgi:predicted NBD/HSP70 family sugar kinase
MGDIPRISRQFSQRSVMEAIVQGGPISRASIAKQTGLSKQTISEIVRGLEQEGWVQETGRTSGHVGRTAVTYELVHDAAYIVAVDLGGTKVRVALTDLVCQIFAEETASTDARGGKFIVDQIATLAFQAAARQRIARRKIRLAVIGVPGAPDQRTGRVLLAPNIGGFDEIDVVEAFAQGFGFAALVENDVNLAVLGENWMGKGQGIDNLAYVALGTGIGCGIMVDGHLVRGATNAAGEMGFLPIGADAYQTESLRVGAFERAVATHAIVDRYAQMTGKRVSVPTIFEKAEAGEPAALSVLDSIARYLAQGVAALAAIVNPEKVILGGSIGLRPEILSRVQALLPQCFPYKVTVEASELGSRATIIGAAAIGLSQLHHTLFGVDAPDGRLSLPPANAGLLTETAL